ncbi:MAG: hypothetical protein K5769_10725 [Pseudobutyrivibrio sp.]|nr:hypothetical protein [Pseudobutyrivibrio sp.]
MKTTSYTKPNIGNLKGKIGKSILETVRNTPIPDRTNLEAEVRELENKIMADRKK